MSRWIVIVWLVIVFADFASAQDECHFGSPEAFDALAKALTEEKSCQAAAKKMHDCAWGSSADTQLAPIVISKCEKTFFPDLPAAGRAYYEDEMQLCAYEFAKAQGTISMSAAALCQLDVATKVAANPEAAQQPIARASFECNKATTALEKGICSDNRLGHADVILNRVYRRFLASLPKERRSDFTDSQKQWLRGVVQGCGASDSPLPLAVRNCVSNEFENRFTDIDSCFDSPEQQSAAECLRDAASLRDETITLEAKGAARASFDCERPKSSLQLAICADTGLGQADIKLSEAFIHASGSLAPDERARLIQSQKEWVRYVANLCPMGTTGGIPPLLTRSCIRTAFETRTAQLPDCIAKEVPKQSQCLSNFKLFVK